MNGLREKIIDNYKAENFNNAEIVKFNEKNYLNYYKISELNELTSDWFPLSCYIDSKTSELVYGGCGNVFHTYVEGETGSGKTTRLVIQSINALCNLKNKPSFVVVDPYGEVYENTSEILSRRGYDIKILNADDPTHSNTYNPFASLTKKVLLDGEINYDVLSQIRKISELVVPVNSKDEPIWEQGACSYFNGLILDCFEDLLEGFLSPENINFYNLLERHFWLRLELADLGDRNILKIPHYEKKGKSCLSVQKMLGVTNNADKTRDSYFGVFENYAEKFCQKSVYQLSSSNTINLEKAIERPTIIFIQSGLSSIGDSLVSLLLNDLYHVVVRNGKKSSTKNNIRPIHCFIDEFANCNFGSGDEFIKMLTTSRKFGMFWHMYLQCDAQLDKKYNSQEIGNIIRANSTEIFLGSQDFKTIDRFARSCGQKTIESLNSKLYQNEASFETVSLITTDKLMTTEPGYMYIKVNKKPLLYSYFEAFYNCKEFERYRDITYPTNLFDYTKTLKLPIAEKKKKRYDWFFDDLPDRYDELCDKLRWMITDKGNVILVCDINEQEKEKFESKPYIAESELFLVIDKTNIEKDQNDLLNVEFNEFIKTCDVPNTLYELSRYSSIPNIITNYFDNTLQKPTLDINQLKFVIIETYVINNNFSEIKLWQKNFQNEVNGLVNNKLLPVSILEIYKDAQKEMESFTLENILDIKKIVD